MPNKRTYIFTGIPPVDGTLRMRDIGDVPSFLTRFKTQRTQSGETTIGATVNETAQNYYNAILADFAQFWNMPEYSISYNGTDSIEVYYEDSEDYWYTGIGGAGNWVYSVNVVIPPADNYAILSYSTEEADSTQCDYFKINLETNRQTYSVQYSVNPNYYTTEVVNSSDFSIDVPRGTKYYVLTSSDGEIINTSYPSIPAFSLDYNIQNQPTGGATVTFTATQTPGTNLSYEYSLDNTNWQVSNSFGGLLEGEYTAYVRDNYGCTKTIDFEVTDIIVTPPPYFKVPILNSIKYALRDEKKRNISNTLSYEEKGNNYKDFYHRFEEDAIITTQFRSSYKYNRAFLLNEGEIVNALTVTKKSSNINKNYLYEALQLFTEDNKLAVRYSNTKQQLDPVTEQPIGQSNLSGTLLFANEVGSFVEVEGYGWLEIKEIVNDQGSQINNEPLGEYMVFDVPFSGTLLGTVNVRTITNLEDYEVYEFQTDFSGLNGCFQVLLGYSNDSLVILDEFQYLSEPILVNPNPDYSDFFEINYSNTENNQITWETGIQGYAILEGVYSTTFEPVDESDVYTTDQKKIAIEYDLDERYTFQFQALPLSIARQVAYIISCDTLQIDGLYYVKEDTPDIEPLTGSNLYNVRVTLTLTDGFNSNQMKGITDIDGTVRGYINNNSGAGYINN